MSLSWVTGRPSGGTSPGSGSGLEVQDHHLVGMDGDASWFLAEVM
jgi:hypothetical protein